MPVMLISNHIWDIQVVALGLTQLEGREKRNFNERRVTALGGAAKKRENVPYHILMGMRKKQKNMKKT